MWMSAPEPVAAALLTVLPTLAIVGALKDLTSYTIPNWISLALLAVFPLAALAVGLPLSAAGVHLAVFAVMLVAGVVMFALGWVGGGDAKLLAACSLWLGLPAVTELLLVGAVIGGMMTLFLISARAQWRSYAVPGAPAWLDKLLTVGGDLPYGVAIAGGALAAFPRSSLFTAFTGVF